jgi:hypothetical protein
MRISPRTIVTIVLSLSCPIGAGCSGGPIEGSGAGGAVDPSTGDFPQQENVAVSVSSGNILLHGNWTKGYGDAEDQHASAVAVNDAGDIALAGTAKGTINFGNIPWTGSTTDTDVVVAKISSEGQAQWSRRYGDSCDQRGGAVAQAPSGNVVIAGDFCGKMDFGTTTIETKGAEVDLFVAAIDTLGEDIYSRRFGGKGAQIARAATVDSMGNAIIVGSFDQAFDDGGGEAATAGLDDSFVIKLDPKGNLLWSQRFGGPESDLARGVAVDGKGNIVVGGSFGGSVDFGGGPITAGAGATSGFVLALDPGGKYLWARSFGTGEDAVVTAVAAGPTGNVAATGFFLGTADFGGGPSPSAGAEDVFITVMSSAGDPIWARTFGGLKSQRATGVTFAATGDVVISGSSDGTLDLFDAPSSNIAVAVPMPLSGLGLLYAVWFDSAGKPVAGRVLDSGGPIESVGVGFDGKLGMILAGSFEKTLTSPYGVFAGAGGWDMFVSREQN